MSGGLPTPVGQLSKWVGPDDLAVVWLKVHRPFSSGSRLKIGQKRQCTAFEARR